MAGKKVGSDGQVRKTTAEWTADTATYPEGMRLMDVDTGTVRVSKGTTYALAWVPASGGGGDYSPPIPQSDVTDLEDDLTAIVAQAARDRHPVITFSTNTTTNADPGQATIRFNNGTIASVTEIALSDADSESIDKGDLNSRCAGIIQLRTVASAATIEFLITAIVHTSWTRYTVTYLKGSLPTNGTAMTYKFLPSNAATPAVTTALAGKVDSASLPLRYKFTGDGGAATGTIGVNTFPMAVTVTNLGVGLYYFTAASGTPFTTGKTYVNVALFTNSPLAWRLDALGDTEIRIGIFDTTDGSAADPTTYLIAIETEP